MISVIFVTLTREFFSLTKNTCSSKPSDDGTVQENTTNNAGNQTNPSGTSAATANKFEPDCSAPSPTHFSSFIKWFNDESNCKVSEKIYPEKSTLSFTPMISGLHLRMILLP